MAWAVTLMTRGARRVVTAWCGVERAVAARARIGSRFAGAIPSPFQATSSAGLHRAAPTIQSREGCPHSRAAV